MSPENCADNGADNGAENVAENVARELRREAFFMLPSEEDWQYLFEIDMTAFALLQFGSNYYCHLGRHGSPVRLRRRRRSTSRESTTTPRPEWLRRRRATPSALASPQP